MKNDLRNSPLLILYYGAVRKLLIGDVKLKTTHFSVPEALLLGNYNKSLFN